LTIAKRPALNLSIKSHTTMAPPRTLILSRSLYATLLLIAAVLTKLPVQPAGRLRPQLINSPPRQARKLTHSTLFLASRPIFLPSHRSTIMETQSPALVLTALAPPTLASAQHQRSSSQSALMTERRLLSRRLTRFRTIMDLRTTSGLLPNSCVTP